MEAIQISTVEDYLKMVSAMRKQISGPDSKYKFSSIEEFILQYGQHYPEYQTKPKWVKKGIIKECFSNCLHALMGNSDRLIYCEGYASGVIPVHHAWLMLDGKVVDPTWHGRDIVSPKTEYFGIQFNTQYVLKVARESGYYGVLDNFAQNYPLLRGEHGPEIFLNNN